MMMTMNKRNNDEDDNEMIMTNDKLTNTIKTMTPRASSSGTAERYRTDANTDQRQHTGRTT